MKSRFFKTTIFILFIVTFLVACGNGNTEEGNGNDNEAGNQEGSSTELNIVDGKIEPAVTITTVMAEDANIDFREGESYEDNVLTRWAQEDLGVNIDVM